MPIIKESKELLQGRVSIEQLHEAFNWKVNKENLYRKDDAKLGTIAHVPDFFATVRENQDGSKQSLGVVKGRYQVIQNDDILETVENVLGVGAGSPFDFQVKDSGARFAFRLLFPKYLCPNVQDKSDFLQLALTVKGSHDGSSGLTVQVSPIRAYCTNGLLTLGKVYAIQSIRHTRSANLGLQNIRQILEAADQEFDVLGVQIGTLSRVEFKQDQHRVLEQYAKDVLEITEPDRTKISTRQLNQVDEIVSLANRGKGNHGRTLWDAYNGLTEYVDHFRGTDEGRDWNALAGTGSELKRRALEVALEYVEAKR